MTQISQLNLYVHFPRWERSKYSDSKCALFHHRAFGLNWDFHSPKLHSRASLLMDLLHFITLRRSLKSWNFIIWVFTCAERLRKTSTRSLTLSRFLVQILFHFTLHMQWLTEKISTGLSLRKAQRFVFHRVFSRVGTFTNLGCWRLSSVFVHPSNLIECHFIFVM